MCTFQLCYVYHNLSTLSAVFSEEAYQMLFAVQSYLDKFYFKKREKKHSSSVLVQ